MQIRVRVSALGIIKQGMSKNGKPYAMQDFVGDTYDQPPHRVHFTVFNPGVKFPMPRLGDDATVDIEISSRSWTGSDGQERWSTDVIAVNIAITPSMF